MASLQFPSCCLLRQPPACCWLPCVEQRILGEKMVECTHTHTDTPPTPLQTHSYRKTCPETLCHSHPCLFVSYLHLVSHLQSHLVCLMVAMCYLSVLHTPCLSVLHTPCLSVSQSHLVCVTVMPFLFVSQSHLVCVTISPCLCPSHTLFISQSHLVCLCPSHTLFISQSHLVCLCPSHTLFIS